MRTDREPTSVKLLVDFLKLLLVVLGVAILVKRSQHAAAPVARRACVSYRRRPLDALVPDFITDIVIKRKTYVQ